MNKHIRHLLLACQDFFNQYDSLVREVKEDCFANPGLAPIFIIYVPRAGSTILHQHKNRWRCVQTDKLVDGVI